MSHAAPGDNIALASNGGISTQSTYFNTDWSTSVCIDGVTEDNGNSALCHSHRDSGGNSWWDLQLANSAPIDSIVIYNRVSCCSERMLNMYVLVSSTPFPAGDDAASLTAARAQASFEYQITEDVPITTITLNSHVGQYIRLQQAGPPHNTHLVYNFKEIQVFEGLEPVDLAITKNVNNTTPNINDVLTFTLDIENVGTYDAIDVTVNDTLPDGLGSASNISNGGALVSPNTVSWSIPLIGVGVTLSLTFDAVVLPH